METVTSRKNKYICHIRALSSDSEYRKDCGEYVCDGMKTLREALAFGAEILCVLWRDKPSDIELPEKTVQLIAPSELFEYASPLKSSGGPVFTVRIRDNALEPMPKKLIVLENLQDPGNVGTVLRTANAFGIDAVILVGACADVYNPKTVRASMGAIFRQRVFKMSIPELKAYLNEHSLPLYGAALSNKAVDIRSIKLSRAAAAIGSEGSGLTKELLNICSGEIVIPMQPDSESLNAAVAAAVVMWEMSR